MLKNDICEGQNHRPETAPLKEQNIQLLAIDTHRGASLILIDLSAAFDTVHHTILLHQLHELEIRDWWSDWLYHSEQMGLIWASVPCEKNMFLFCEIGCFRVK